MALIDALRDIIGPANVLTGEETARYSHDWTGKYVWTPLAVVRPASREEVAAVLRLCAGAGVPVVPTGGGTGLNGGTFAEGGIMLSLERMNRIREIRPASRIAIVEAGVVLSAIHDAAAEHDLAFPLTFGARGSAQVGGFLSTNAGGSNVVRFGNTRALVLGVEVVLADGRVLDLMSELRKDNTGYDLRDLFIGAEGTLGVITAAVLKLVPAARAHATAMVAVPGLAVALDLLNRLQGETGGAVEAFEYLPAAYMERLARHRPDLKEPFATRYPSTLLIEIGVTAPHEAEPLADGSLPVVTRLEDTLAMAMARGEVLDATLARTEAQRAEMWAAREAAAEITFAQKPHVDTDISLPLDRMQDFLTAMTARLHALDPGADELAIAHLGDGNFHYTAFPTRDDAPLLAALRNAVAEEAVRLGGSFSAEHGIGLSKRPTMADHKDPVALDVMARIKAALDPQGLLNPGKVLP
ncbi:FAD-dependent oxidoreductase [Haematobacter missouriensis]|uniref:FAD-binding oxidoreductase n=1 Tax=Haematobacter missouriensis TaxID=366616 RepID=A0A212AUA0_9RHOB|nr:FAD-binding oxidoreductase [Haematobacter missouriensis]KFI33366.1 FAD-dependent oxidoreductase [Haematobacter missouriensis]OWJ77194.1 FAD-binding oxidoreductase [Haematobacter missouriensis]OWJ85051.1 FAD-binding oxidoreductase [Haematobacter missouriensis]